MLRRHLIPDLFDRLLRRVHGRPALDRVDRAAAAAEMSRFSATFGTWNQTPAEYAQAFHRRPALWLNRGCRHLATCDSVVMVEPPEDMPHARLAWIETTENLDGTIRVWDWEDVDDGR